MVLINAIGGAGGRNGVNTVGDGGDGAMKFLVVQQYHRNQQQQQQQHLRLKSQFVCVTMEQILSCDVIKKHEQVSIAAKSGSREVWIVEESRSMEEVSDVSEVYDWLSE